MILRTLLRLAIRLPGYGVIALRYLQGRIVGPAEIQKDYDRTAATYLRWTSRMSVHGRSMIHQALGVLKEPKSGEPWRILDLACGTGDMARVCLETLEAEGFRNFTLVGVDISQGMLDKARESITDPRVSFHRADALEFLKSQKSSYFHLIVCGWGMVYLPRNPLIRELYRVLQTGGVYGALMNRRGTLRNIEDIFLEIMASRPGSIRKIMDTRFRLPADVPDFDRWFTAHKFQIVASSQGEEVVNFSTPEDLKAWLTETGALAGTGHLLAADTPWEGMFLDLLKKHLGTQNGYTCNHAFVSGIYQKGV